MSQHRYEVTNEQWEQIKDYFPLYSAGAKKGHEITKITSILASVEEEKRPKSIRLWTD